jgi:hypothetical protein
MSHETSASPNRTATPARRFGAIPIVATVVVGLAVGAGAAFGATSLFGGSPASARLDSAVAACSVAAGTPADVTNFATVTDATHLEYVATGEVESESGQNAHYTNMSCLMSTVGVGKLEFPAILQGPFVVEVETELATVHVTGDDFDSATLTITLPASPPPQLSGLKLLF